MRLLPRLVTWKGDVGLKDAVQYLWEQIQSVVNYNAEGPDSVLFSNLPVAPKSGTVWVITDSTTTTWGANITGGGGSTVLAQWNGTNWTVIGK
jgi:hypothetical protein